MNRMMMEDIALIKTAGNIVISPDGRYAAYSVIEPDLKKNEYRNDIWLLDRDERSVRRLTYSGNNGSFIWDDENTLLIQTSRSEEDKPEDIEEKTSFYRLPVNGGEARPAFTLNKNVQQVEKAGSLYAMRILVDRNRPDPEVTDKEKCKEELDYHIFEEVPFWGNGRGYVSGKRSVLFLFDEKTGDLKRLSGEFTSVYDMKVKDGMIAYRHCTWEDVINVKSGITLYDIASDIFTTVLPEGEMKTENIAFTDNGLLFTASDMKQWGNGQLTDYYLYDMESAEFSLFRKNDEELAHGDCPAIDTMRPYGTKFKWFDGHLTFTAMKHYHTDLYRLSAGGDLKCVCGLNDGAVTCFDEDENGVCLIGSEKNALNAVYMLTEDGLVKVHDVNEGFLADRFVSEAEYIPFTNRDGVEIDGWILKPKDFDPEKKYPGILEIHGGPRAAYGTILHHEMQIWASDGYFVFYCNPRGGEGYGEVFADLRGKYGTIDFRDLMDFTDHVLEIYPQIDPERLGASGGSYGGFMCNWIEGNTDRFAAIASQRSISNWVADFGASEIGVTFDSNEMGATPWTDMLKMWDQSPLKYACNAKTPILFIHSLCDYNCPIDQGIEMFAAMKYHHVPSRMVVFEQENHGLSRSGKPKHRIRRLLEITNWFEKYLKA